MGADIEAIEKLLLELYGLARELPLHEFQAHALRLLNPHLKFCSAVWGTGKREQVWFTPHHVQTHEIDPEAVTHWREIIQFDKAIPVVRASRRGQTIQLHAPTLFDSGSPGDLVMRDYAARYGRQSYMVTDIRTQDAGAVHWISLYRPDPDDHFTEHERLLCERLMPHFHQALQINRTLAGLGVISGELDAQSHFALVDRDGFVLFAQAGFLELLHLEWSQLDDYVMPEPLMAALRTPGVNTFIGRRIRCDRQTAGEHILLRAKRATHLDRLSPRQHEIAQLYAGGHSHKEIAQRLHVAPATVRNHLAAIYSTLAISRKAELIALTQ